MCDCYETKCECCRRDVPVHIGDFSAGRECVKVWCPKCLGAFTEFLCVGWSRCGKVFTDRPDGRERGKPYVFWVQDPHQIHLNG